MKKIAINSEMPIGKLFRVKDFLPPPAQLAAPVVSMKITIALNKASIEFFKRQARLHHTKYQRMIRELIDHYAAQYS